MKNPFKTKDFVSQKNKLVSHIDKNGIESIHEYCSLTGIPLVVAYKFVLEDLPKYKEECEFKINSLENFYGYK